MINFCIPWRMAHDGYREASFRYLLRRLGEEWSTSEARIVVCDSHDVPFSRSASRNAAAGMAVGDVLVFLDADSYVSPHQVKVAVDVAYSHGWCFPYDVYYSLTKGGTAKFMFDAISPDVDEHHIEFTFPGPDPVDRPASVGGCVVVHRDAFERVGGYDERFVGWAFEDRAFAYSLEAFYSSARRIPGPIYHLWHPAPEEECFGQPYMEANRALANRYRDAIGNQDLMSALVSERP